MKKREWRHRTIDETVFNLALQVGESLKVLDYFCWKFSWFILEITKMRWPTGTLFFFSFEVELANDSKMLSPLEVVQKVENQLEGKSIGNQAFLRLKDSFVRSSLAGIMRNLIGLRCLTLPRWISLDMSESYPNGFLDWKDKNENADATRLPNL